MLSKRGTVKKNIYARKYFSFRKFLRQRGAEKFRAAIGLIPVTFSGRARQTEFSVKGGLRCCQTNANQSLFSSDLKLLGCAETAPLGQSSGTVVLEI